jgi:carboxyl-terminal processing protease
MDNKLKIKTPILFALTMLAGMYFGSVMQKNMGKKASTKIDKIGELRELIKRKYVDEVKDSVFLNLGKKDNSQLADSLENVEINLLLDKLDPHSVYLPPTQLKQSNEDMKGEFAGIGVEYSIFNDTVFANYIVPNGPASKASMQVGDMLYAVYDSIICGVNITPTRLRKLLRGELNSVVMIQIIRNNEKKNLTITRGNVALPSLDAAYMINQNLGYIKLSKFSLTSYVEFKEALQNLKNKGMQQLIFDLRDNGGGILQDAVQIVDEFVAGEELVTYTQGAHVKKQTIYTKNKGLFETGKLVVLLNEFSASASEVVAGALQDLDRATIVGRRSFGKGLVQQQFGFSDNSAVRLTVARYYTPSGRSIQKSYSNGKDAYENDLMDRYHKNGLNNADSNKMDIGKIYKTKGGKTVYGGGGISPDYFVALDTTNIKLDAFNKLLEKNTMINFCFKYSQINKSNFNKEPNLFIQKFNFSEAEWGQFVAMSKADGIDLSKINTKQKAFLKDRLKQQLARQLWRNNGLFQAINATDVSVKKAIEVISN